MRRGEEGQKEKMGINRREGREGTSVDKAVLEHARFPIPVLSHSLP